MSDLCDARGAAADPPADATASVDVHVDIVAKMVRLWSTNDPPLDSESAVLTDVLESTRVRLGAVDAELAGLKARVQCLEQDRSDLSSLEANVANVLSPLRRVPRDILAEIFDWTLDPTEPAPWELCPCAPLSIATSPWVLTHVSSLWRAVAVASPSLWAPVGIDFNVKERYPALMLRTHMARARRLNIRFFATEEGDHEHQRALFALLAEESDKWQRLTIQVSSRLAQEGYDLDLRSLRSVWLQWATPYRDMQDAFSTELLRTATDLVDIGVDHPVDFVPSSLPPVHAITRYDVDCPWTTHVGLLRSLPNLQEARIAVGARLEAPVESPIVLPDLRGLYIDDPACLQALDVPALEALAVTARDPTELDALVRFLESASCALHRICFHGLLYTEGLADILQKFPSLTDVGLSFANYREEEDYGMGEQVERALVTAFLDLFTLAPAAPSTAVLPHVTEIRLACEYDHPTYLPLLVEMLRSRMRAEPRTIKAAKLVCLTSEMNPVAHSVEKMKALQMEGLQVSLSCGGVGRRLSDRWLCKAGWP